MKLFENMFSAIKSLFAKKNNNAPQITYSDKCKLIEAIRDKDVQTAYKLLKGGVSPNFVEVYYNVHDDYAFCPLSFAEERNYEPMIRLLKYFNALTIKEIRELERKAINERYRASQENAGKKLQEDNAFLDNVLK